MKYLYIIIIKCFLTLITVKGQISPTEKQQFESKLEQLNTKIEAVTKTLPKTKNFLHKSVTIDIEVARFFSQYIKWELQHPEFTAHALGESEYFKNIKLSKAEKWNRYRFHINHQLTSSIQILDQALNRISSNKKWPTPKKIQWNKVKYENGFFRYKDDPVFLSGFNMLLSNTSKYNSDSTEWKQPHTEYLNTFLTKMHQLDVSLVGKGINLPALIQKDGSINTKKINALAQNILKNHKKGFLVDILLGYSGDKETLEKSWPEITKYHANGVAIDIDHPGLDEIIGKVMDQLMPILKKTNAIKAIASWDLANEPFFSMKMWSKHTLKKYHQWLEKKHSNINTLNTLWGTKFTKFSDIPLPSNSKADKCLPGQKYDRITFHNTRVTNFFELIQRHIKKHLPNAIIHLKGQDNNSLGPLDNATTDGIDREMLTPMATMHGLDTRPLPVTEKRMAAGNKGKNPNKILHYDNSHYSFHWLGQSFLYDYLTSLAPHRPIVDFEYHAFSINPIRIPDISQKHASSSLWLAHMHGMVGNMVWYWHKRFGPHPFSKNFNIWFYGSISTQPLIAAEYFHTMLRLNTFSKQVEALATVKEKPLQILVSKPSYIHNRSHIDALHRTYEGTCFHSFPVGFLTENTLSLGKINKHCKIIILPDIEFISKKALIALKKAHQKGIKIIRFGTIKPQRDPYGTPHPRSLTQFLDNVTAFNYSDAKSLSSQLEPILKPIKSNLHIAATHINAQNSFGIIQRQATLNGKHYLLLVNVSNKPTQIKIKINKHKNTNINAFDIIHREKITTNTIALPIQGVRLIEINN